MKEANSNNQFLIISQDTLNEQSEKFVTAFDSNFLNVKLVSSYILNDEKELNKLKNVKAIMLIVDKDKETTIETCSTIIKIRNVTDTPIWLYSKPYLAVEREVFLNIGIDGFFNDTQSLSEIELTILNLLKRTDEVKKEEMTSTPSKDVLLMSENIKRNPELNKKNKRKNRLFEEKIEEKKEIVIRLDSKNERIWVDNLEVSLSSKQFILAELLINHKNNIVDYETIYKAIWDDKYDKEKRNMVGAIVAQLRSKFERNKITTRFIINVPNAGYKFIN